MTRLLRGAAAAAVLALAACARPPAPMAEAADDPRIAACRLEARNSDGVRAAARQANAENATQRDRVAALRAMAEADAFDACLRREGVRRAGGVERVRPQGFSW